MIQHISIRVPWHDCGWNGNICKSPDTNISCLRLKNIQENRNDIMECKMCGECMVQHEKNIPCIDEGGAFMSKNELCKTTIHPYKQRNSSTHGHFLDTDIIYPAYSLPARPFAWLMLDNIISKAENYGIKYNVDIEPKLDFKTAWVQEAKNHRAIFDYFYQDIVPDKSLCVMYAKQVPFIDDNRRVIIGMGHVKKVIPAIEHNHKEDGKLRSLTWETMICHSVRENHKDGFIIPYKEMMEYARKHPDFDISSITVFAPDDAFDEFSYATEHLNYDSVIDVILSCIKSFNIINKCLDEDYTNVIKWLNEKLENVWKERGAFPGLGAMFTALGIKLGVPMAKYIKENIKENEDIWEYINKVIELPDEYLPEDISSCIKPINQKTWSNLGTERKELFKLLSRFALNIKQAEVLYNEDERKKHNIECTDKQILENPYILYEQTRLKQDELYLSIPKVDRAIFSAPSILEEYNLEEPSKLTSENDERRIRAIVVAVLEEEASKGNTFLPCNILINKVKSLTLKPECIVTKDMISAIETFMKPQVIKKEMKDGTYYYKLVRLNEFDEIIEKRVSKRLNSAKIEVNANWKKMLDEKFGQEDNNAENEKLARKEKEAVLKVLAESRISVLVGNAGTGKTSVLSILCSEQSIKDGGVLLLAPTGKATVRLLESMGQDKEKYTALNIAQFLNKSKRFDWNDMRYRLSKINDPDIPETVIIDEASMLTEEMFGALLEAIGKAKRIIFVGDPNQLPPIGTGKPFVDLVNLLKENLKQDANPKVCNCYGELQINMRQEKFAKRLDAKFSKCFTRNRAIRR